MDVFGYFMDELDENYDTASYARVYQTRAGFHTPTHASNYLQTDGQLKLAAVFSARDKIILSVSQRLRCGPGGIAFTCVRLIHITKKIGKLQYQVWLVSTETIYTKQITRKNNIHSPPL